MRLVLIEPEIPQNVGAAIRAAACFGAEVDIIEPCGFPVGEKEMRRVAMDYALLAPPVRHSSWATFLTARSAGRLVLLTTRAATTLWEHAFRADDLILVGAEGSGAPAYAHEAADTRVRIPLAAAARSLNVAAAAAIALAEARRQTGYSS